MPAIYVFYVNKEISILKDIKAYCLLLKPFQCSHHTYVNDIKLFNTKMFGLKIKLSHQNAVQFQEGITIIFFKKHILQNLVETNMAKNCNRK